MELAPYLAQLQEQLLLTVEASGPDAQAVATRLVASLEPAARLALLDALSAAAAEITQELAPGSVEVRLRGRDPELVVTAPPAPEPVGAPTADEPAYDNATARINLRLPQDLKDRVEEAARAGGISVNTWLVRAASAAVGRAANGEPGRARSGRGGQSFTGWVR